MFYLTTHSTHCIYGYMEGRKEMFYLTMHSTHCIYGYMEVGKKEMFYLTTHSTHCIYGYMEGRKEGNVLFNDALNTLYLQLYGIRHMIKEPQTAREETCCHHMGYSFRLTARLLLYAQSHSLFFFYTSRGALAGTRCHLMNKKGILYL